LNTIIVKYIAITLLICTVTIGKGQNTSTPDNSLQKEQELPKIHSPHKATIYSALIPGLGQIYNKKYWKLPIIYGATGIFIYAFDFNNTEYNKYKTAYTKMSNGEIIEFEGYTDAATLLRIKDSYQRNRDLNVIVLAAIYMLNIVDATVDAHLFDYKISDDLSLNVQPTVKRTYANQSTLGVSLSFSF
jgi:hypothetical protein